MKTVAILLAVCGSYLGSMFARSSAWEARDTWPIAAQSVVSPELAKGAGLLLGREMAADLFWVRGLVYYGSARAETGDYDQLEQIIDAILELDPYFKQVYEWAAYAVTFKQDIATKDEFAISLRYLEKAMKQYPQEAKYFWLAGMRYYADLNSDDPDQRKRDQQRGAELISQSMTKNGANPRMATLAASLHTKLGQKERAVRELQQMIMSTDNPVARKQIENRLMGMGGQDLLAETVEARREFDARHKAELPLTPPSFYVMMGPPHPPLTPQQLAHDDLFVLADDGSLVKQ